MLEELVSLIGAGRSVGISVELRVVVVVEIVTETLTNIGTAVSTINGPPIVPAEGAAVPVPAIVVLENKGASVGDAAALIVPAEGAAVAVAGITAGSADVVLGVTALSLNSIVTFDRTPGPPVPGIGVGRLSVVLVNGGIVTGMDTLIAAPGPPVTVITVGITKVVFGNRAGSVVSVDLF